MKYLIIVFLFGFLYYWYSPCILYFGEKVCGWNYGDLAFLTFYIIPLLLLVLTCLINIIKLIYYKIKNRNKNRHNSSESKEQLLTKKLKYELITTVSLFIVCILVNREFLPLRYHNGKISYGSTTMGLIDQYRRTVLPKEYEIISLYKDKAFCKKDGTWGVFSTKFDYWLIPMGETLESYCKQFQQYDQYGFINQDEEIVIPAEYDNIIESVRGLYVVKQNGRYGIINNVGRIVVDPHDRKYFDYDLLRGQNDDTPYIVMHRKDDEGIIESYAYLDNNSNCRVIIHSQNKIIEILDEDHYISYRENEEYKYNYSEKPDVWYRYLSGLKKEFNL